MSLENLTQAFSSLSRLQKCAEQPSVEALGPIDFDLLEERDKPFFKKLLILAQDDPQIISRVLNIRTKLNNGIKLDHNEATELLCVLECQGFYHTDLDITGMEFQELNLPYLFIGRDLHASGVKVHGNNNQEFMHVRGNNHQSNMQVEGENNQNHAHVKGTNDQSGMQILRDNSQSHMQVGIDNKQEGMKVGNWNWQWNMRIGRDNIQAGMQVERDNGQHEMEIGGKNNQDGMSTGYYNYPPDK